MVMLLTPCQAQSKIRFMGFISFILLNKLIKYGYECHPHFTDVKTEARNNQVIPFITLLLNDL